MSFFFRLIAILMLTYGFSLGAASGGASQHAVIETSVKNEGLALKIPEGRINQVELERLLNELNDHLAQLAEQDRKLSSRIDSLADDAATERFELRRAVNSLHEDAVALNIAIGAVSSELERVVEEFGVAKGRLEEANRSVRAELRWSTEALGEELNRIEEVVLSLDLAREGFAGRLTQFERRLDQRAAQVDEKVLAVADSVDEVRGSLDDRYGSMRKDLVMRSVIGLFALVSLVVFVILVAKRLAARQRSVAEEVQGSIRKTQEEQNRLDLKLSEFLERQLTETPNVAGENHDFFTNLADEINRMRKRFARMPENTKGIKPLEKTLERLERGLNERGYDITDLLGEPYVEGMVVKPRFVSDDSLPLGQQKITNIIKPQVSFGGKIIQVAEIEVSVG